MIILEGNLHIEKFKETAIELLEVLSQNGYTHATIQEVLESLKAQKQLTLSHNELLEEKFKQIALESIHSYKDSSKKFSDIAKEQAKHLEEVQKTDHKHIDIDALQAKFSDIQEHMFDEIKRANTEIARLTQKVKLLEEESNIDPLTKVFNRRALNTYLNNICKKGKLQQELHLLILDIDDFKQINDKYGHIAGDKILIFISHILRKMLRESDKIFRYGGEEFVIILNRIATRDCQIISNRILKQISSNSLIYKGDTIHVTVSIGTTRFQDGDTPETLINRADKALYAAKNSGKNKVVTL